MFVVLLFSVDESESGAGLGFWFVILTRLDNCSLLVRQQVSFCKPLLVPAKLRNVGVIETEFDGGREGS